MEDQGLCTRHDRLCRLCWPRHTNNKSSSIYRLIESSSARIILFFPSHYSAAGAAGGRNKRVEFWLRGTRRSPWETERPGCILIYVGAYYNSSRLNCVMLCAAVSQESRFISVHSSSRSRSGRIIYLAHTHTQRTIQTNNLVVLHSHRLMRGRKGGRKLARRSRDKRRCG